MARIDRQVDSSDLFSSFNQFTPRTAKPGLTFLEIFYLQRLFLENI